MTRIVTTYDSRYLPARIGRWLIHRRWINPRFRPAAIGLDGEG
jgi:hypothetical protein